MICEAALSTRSSAQVGRPRPSTNDFCPSATSRPHLTPSHLRPGVAQRRRAAAAVAAGPAARVPPTTQPHGRQGPRTIMPGVDLLRCTSSATVPPRPAAVISAGSWRSKTAPGGRVARARLGLPRRRGAAPRGREGACSWIGVMRHGLPQGGCSHCSGEAEAEEAEAAKEEAVGSPPVGRGGALAGAVHVCERRAGGGATTVHLPRNLTSPRPRRSADADSPAPAPTTPRGGAAPQPLPILPQGADASRPRPTPARCALSRAARRPGSNPVAAAQAKAAAADLALRRCASPHARRHCRCSMPGCNRGQQYAAAPGCSAGCQCLDAAPRRSSDSTGTRRGRRRWRLWRFFNASSASLPFKGRCRSAPSIEFAYMRDNPTSDHSAWGAGTVRRPRLP